MQKQKQSERGRERDMFLVTCCRYVDNANVKIDPNKLEIRLC